MEQRHTGPVQPEAELEIIEIESNGADTLSEEEMRERATAIIGRVNGLLFAGPNGTLDKKLLPETHTAAATSDRLKGVSASDATPWIDMGDVDGGVLQVKMAYWRDRLAFSGQFNDRQITVPVDRTPFPMLLTRKRHYAGDYPASPAVEFFRIDTRKRDDQRLLWSGDEMPTDAVVWDQVTAALDVIEAWRNEPNLLRPDKLEQWQGYYAKNFKGCIDWADSTDYDAVTARVDKSTTASFTQHFRQWERDVRQEGARLENDPRWDIAGRLAIVSVKVDAGFNDEKFVVKSLVELNELLEKATEYGLTDLQAAIEQKVEQLEQPSDS